ncbi:TMhelix containing protein [Vibrio phage 511E55-1]|nr:TMhelix containing protein [Vibrio phage 511E55-1]
MKNVQVMAMCAAAILLCLSINVVFHMKEGSRFDAIDKKLIEVDGRRNAQYGILKRAIEQCEAN